MLQCLIDLEIVPSAHHHDNIFVRCSPLPCNHHRHLSVLWSLARCGAHHRRELVTLPCGSNTEPADPKIDGTADLPPAQSKHCFKKNKTKQNHWFKRQRSAQNQGKKHIVLTTERRSVQSRKEGVRKSCNCRGTDERGQCAAHFGLLRVNGFTLVTFIDFFCVPYSLRQHTCQSLQQQREQCCGGRQGGRQLHESDS